MNINLINRKLDKELFIRNLFNNAGDFKKYIVAIYSFIKKDRGQF